jgi:hypothetical protein
MLQTPRRTRWIVLAAALVLGSLLGPPTLLALPQRPAPLLAVEGPLQQTITQGFAPPIQIDIAPLALFVLPGGDVVESDLNHGKALVMKGPATAALFDRLRGRLAASRAGVQGDCGAPGSVFLASFDWRITWTGRHGRSNAFRVVTEDKSLPSCPDELLTLIEEIFYFRYQFSLLPTTEWIFSGPH